MTMMWKKSSPEEIAEFYHSCQQDEDKRDLQLRIAVDGLKSIGYDNTLSPRVRARFILKLIEEVGNG